MKIRPSVKKICDKCKSLNVRVKYMLYVKTLSTNKDKVNRRCLNGTY